MLTYRKWIVTLGIMAVTPTFALAGPLSFFKSGSARSAAGGAQQGAASRQNANQSPNQRTAEQIAATLRSANLKATEIDIEFDKGVALLTGKVADITQKVRATRLAAQIPGVKRVDNQLSLVQPGQFSPASSAASSPYQQLSSTDPNQLPTLATGKTERRSRIPLSLVKNAAPMNQQSAPNNQKVAEDIAGALSSAKLNGFDIEVRYKGGRAILTGSVANAEQWRTARQVVQQVPGVQAVDNRLSVRNPPGGPSANPNGPGPGQNPYGQPPVMAAGYAAEPTNGPPTAPPGMQAAGAYGPSMGGGYPGQGNSQAVYDMPHLPENAWPATAAYPNYAQVTYPQQYSASAWPYIGPFYPYPQIPLGWRQAQLEWDDGYWNLNFRPRTDRWYWFLHPKNW